MPHLKEENEEKRETCEIFVCLSADNYLGEVYTRGKDRVESRERKSKRGRGVKEEKGRTKEEEEDEL